MHKRIRPVIGLAALVALIGCAPSRPPLYGGSEGSRYYFLCCSLRFNQDRDASDAGYLYEPGTTLPAGTPVLVVHEENRLVTIQPAGSTERYDLVFRYGHEVISPTQYFEEVLLRDDPRAALAALRPDVADAIAHNVLRVGMTKAEAIQARGYPPRHQTRSIDNDEWLYYDSRVTVSRVRFDGGVITVITQEKAPGS